MAGHGPAPKKRANRTNHHAPLRGEWVTLPALPYRGEKPTLPRVKGGLLESTKRVWADWWDTPMAHMWNRSDWPVLVQLLLMIDRINRSLNSSEFFTGYASMVTESRLLRDALGLTEKGRRDLRWELPGESGPESEGPHLAAVVELRPSRARPDPRKKS